VLIRLYRQHPQRLLLWAGGVTRLDGARCKKQVWRPHVRNWSLSEANVLQWRKYLWLWWDFSASPAVIWRPHSDSAPEELRSPCPPRYDPGYEHLVTEDTMFNYIFIFNFEFFYWGCVMKIRRSSGGVLMQNISGKTSMEHLVLEKKLLR